MAQCPFLCLLPAAPSNGNLKEQHNYLLVIGGKGVFLTMAAQSIPSPLTWKNVSSVFSETYYQVNVLGIADNVLYPPQTKSLHNLLSTARCMLPNLSWPFLHAKHGTDWGRYPPPPPPPNQSLLHSLCLHPSKTKERQDLGNQPRRSLLSFIRLTLIFSFICPLCMSVQNWSSEEAIITSKGIQAAALCLSKSCPRKTTAGGGEGGASSFQKKEKGKPKTPPDPVLGRNWGGGGWVMGQICPCDSSAGFFSFSLHCWCLCSTNSTSEPEWAQHISNSPADPPRRSHS